MKIASYSWEGATKYGAISGDQIIDLSDLAKLQKIELPKQFSDFVAASPGSMSVVRRLFADSSAGDVELCSVSLAKTHLRASLPSPPKIICLGLNYRDHIEETGQDLPDEPVIFMKPRTSIIGPRESIVRPSFVKQLDYEGELAIVIGKEGKKISIDEATDHIFGFTILNDVSARDIQFKDKQWTRGKGFDTFAPTGPCINTADDLKDTSDLAIRTWVNGELRQNSSTAKMLFNVEQIIHHLSRVMTLEPCDIIATGTPAGVGFKMKPNPQFLQEGDTVKIDIEEIGVLENSVVDEKEA